MKLPRPTPMSDLSWPRKLRRAFGALLFVSSIAMAVSASTASSDWNLQFRRGGAGRRLTASEGVRRSPGRGVWVRSRRWEW